jgi:hypothetical protein
MPPSPWLAARSALGLLVYSWRGSTAKMFLCPWQGGPTEAMAVSMQNTTQCSGLAGTATLQATGGVQRAATQPGHPPAVGVVDNVACRVQSLFARAAARHA